MRLVYSLRDFELALSALYFLSELDEERAYPRAELRRFRCDLDTATISYCRPFTMAKGMPRLTLSDFEVKADEADLRFTSGCWHIGIRWWLTLIPNACEFW